MREFVLSEPVNRDLAGYFANFGEVRVRSINGKEVLSFERPGFVSVNGILEEQTVEVRFAPGVYDFAPDLFHLFLYHYSNGKETGKMREILASLEGRVRRPMGC